MIRCKYTVYVIETTGIEENQLSCRGVVLNIKTTESLAQLLVSDVSCLSLITKRLTKGRMACVCSGVKETCWAVRLLREESPSQLSVDVRATCSNTSTSQPVRRCCGHLHPLISCFYSVLTHCLVISRGGSFLSLTDSRPVEATGNFSNEMRWFF